MGRELTTHDRFAIEAMLESAEAGGYKLQDMIVLICQSDLFRGTGGK